MDPEFWQGKKVLITGHTGFKGGWLCLWLQKRGARVTGYALEPPTSPSLFEVADVGAGIDSATGDIRDPEALAEVFSRSSPEIVFHLAAQPLVRLSYREPVSTYATNVLGTAHLLEAVRSSGCVRAVVNVTSDKCYQNREWVWGYREDEPVGGADPYSSSKGCAEIVTGAYRSSFFAPSRYPEHRVGLASARAGNVIGGGDWASDRLVPDFIRAVSTGKSLRIRNPRAVRPWQHVLEPLAGYLRLAECLYREGALFSEAWNFGPDDEGARPVEWVAGRLCALWGAAARWDLEEAPGGAQAVHEANFLKLDCSKAKYRLGWNPGLPLEEACRWTVEWYRAREEGKEMREFCLDQISRYEDLRGAS